VQTLERDLDPRQETSLAMTIVLIVICVICALISGVGI